MKMPDKGSWRKYINKANAKKALNGIRIALVVVLILAELFCFWWLKTLHIRYGVYDYTVTYKEQLDIIFGDDYKISPPETVCGYDVNIVNGEKFYDYFSRWWITYTDSQGDRHSAWLSNEDSREWAFEWRVEFWMRCLVEEHFEDVCENPDYKEIINRVDLHRPTLYVPDEWNIDTPEKWNRDAFREYIFNNMTKSFKDPDNLPHLYEMGFKDWFVTYPSYISIHLNADEISDEILDDVLESLSKETDGRFNLEVEADDEVRYYIMGEPRSFEKYREYDLALYQEYEKMGMFD